MSDFKKGQAAMKEILGKNELSLNSKCSKRQALADLLDIQDSELIDGLIEMGVDEESYLALVVFPVVWLAWADDDLDPSERNEIFFQAEKLGIDKDGPAYLCLENWMSERPDDGSWETWLLYARAWRECLGPNHWPFFAEFWKDSCWATAESSGGLLGLGKTSSVEKKIINEVEEIVAWR